MDFHHPPGYFDFLMLLQNALHGLHYILNS